MLIPLRLGANGRPCTTTDAQCSASRAGQFRRCKARVVNRLVLALVAVAAGVFATSSKAAIIVNGDFETGNLTGWVVDSGPIGDAIGIAPVPYFGAGTTAQNGNFMAAFNQGNGSSAGGSLSQTFGTLPGATYTVDYAFGTTASFGINYQQLDAYLLGANGSTLLHFESHANNNPVPPSPPTPITFTFVADGGLATLRFVDHNDIFVTTFNMDGVLDNVAVSGPDPNSAVPEPTSLVIFGVGTVTCAAFGLRRRKRAA
jgi:hypothetical protein